MPIYDNWTTYDPIVSMLPIYKELIGAGLKIWVFRYIYIWLSSESFVSISVQETN